MLRLLHLLPHPGGGGERYVDTIGLLPDTAQEREYVSRSRSPAGAVLGLPRRSVAIRRAAAGADLVHVHGDMTAVLMLPVLRGRRWTWTTHGLSFLRRSSGPANAVFKPLLARVIRSTTATICTTDAERRELLALVGDDFADRFHVVPNGIAAQVPVTPTERARVRAALDIVSDAPVALFAGRLDDAKGARDVVSAANAAHRSGSTVTVLVAGEGPLEGVLRAAAGEAVHMLGFRRDMDELLGAADIFVLPSRREGSSYAVIEALGAGLAVVVCDGLGNPETVGEAGVVVPCGDVPALTQTLIALAEDPARRRDLGEAGRARVAGVLGEQRFLADVEAIYAQSRASSSRLS